MLENGEVWAANGAGASPLLWFAQGTFTYAGDRIVENQVSQVFQSPSALTEFRESRQFRPAELVTGTSNPLSTLFPPNSPTLKLEFPGESVRTVAVVRAGAEKDYNYDQPASVSQVEGAWTFMLPKLAPQTMTVTGGVLSGVAPYTNCVIAGNLTPRASGKNVFNVNFTLSGCPTASSYIGVAATYRDTVSFIGDPTNQVLLLQAYSPINGQTFHAKVPRCPTRTTCSP
ncbi:hypothetical protein [Ramlibacter albus]|uniref:Uncharacterized protein n=1 Tax=Ramlibacter albus TaxID=2079448 RepID=A0A923MEX9_9BURK|nr:hypothetical protein [Ramlibacter albus]MBC5768341.1 hypothetical protein [Ramlibacter albus]